ncbi:hypothetical protein [Bradyrhizobium sp. USDA 4452]
MYGTEVTALLRTILDEVCTVSAGNRTKAYVASKLLETAANGKTTASDLRDAGLRALEQCPV